MRPACESAQKTRRPPSTLSSAAMWFSNAKSLNLEDTSVIFDGQFLPSDSSKFVVSTVEGDIKCIDLVNSAAGDEISYQFELKRHHRGSSVRKIAFTDENWLVSAAKTIKIFDIDEGKCIRKLTAGGCKLYSLIVLDHYLLAAGDDNGCFRLYDYRTASDTPRMEMTVCEEYISDLDTNSSKKFVLASSGEGTLTAFDVRGKKLSQPQSELFTSGFNCVRVFDAKAKVLLGSDEGFITIFNWRQWGNMSDRFPVMKKSSIECMEFIDTQHLLVGTGEGKTKLVSVFPNTVVKTVFDHKLPVETVKVDLDNDTVVSCAGNEIKVATFTDENPHENGQEKSSSDSSSESSDDEGGKGRKRSKKGKTSKKKRREQSDFFNDL